MNSVETMQRVADNLRVLIVSMVEKARSGHPGGAMGGADFLNVLYAEYLRYDPCNPQWFGRDRFFLDPGHMSPLLYAQLCLAGYFSVEELSLFRQWGSSTPGHPERCLERGIENTSGPLGQGHTYAVGAAIAAKWMRQRFSIHNPTIYAYISDGGIQEEISQGAGRIAGHLGLDNLIMFYDSNDIQLSTRCEEVSSEDVKAKYEAWGWYVQEIDGHNVEQIRCSLDNAIAEESRPSLIIGHTIMGKGCVDVQGQSVENTCSTHGQPISKAGADVDRTIRELGGDISRPFGIFKESLEVYAHRRDELLDYCFRESKRYERWKVENPTLAVQYEDYSQNKVPEIDWSGIEQKSDISTRSASSAVLSYLSATVPNMIVSSADLSNSDKTDGFLKNTQALSRGDFSGQFLQMGVSELTMACISIGMCLHGGVIAACGTFFVFSDYMRPAVRMAALMETPVIFIWTHDSFRVGEDGPTHQPIEHEAQIRLMEKLRNHSGDPSMLVLRPADAGETSVAWQLVLENRHTPSALILSRQDIKSLPIVDYGNVRRGGYVVRHTEGSRVVLLASGSEVATLIEAAGILERENIPCSVVSIPSEGLFRQQSSVYQDSVLPSDIRRFGLTAGLCVTLESLVANRGQIWGRDAFGYSAPYSVLDSQFGFTPEQVAKRIIESLKSEEDGISF